MNVFNPKILDACIRDVTACLSDNDKADVLLSAMEHLPLEQSSRIVIENAVQSCLHITNLSCKNTAKAYVLRAKAKLAAGLVMGCQEDVRTALQADSDNIEAKDLQKTFTAPTRLTLFETHKTPRFSVEIWTEIALFLPRRDLISLLWTPNALSRIASRILFQTIDLHFSRPSPLPEYLDDEEWEVTDKAERVVDSPRVKRSADILTHIIVDRSFASNVRTLRLHAANCAKGSVTFQTGVLANALPRLTNLRNFHCAATSEDMIPILHLVHSSFPRLRGLSLACPDIPPELDIPEFKHLKHLTFIGHSSNAAPMRNLLLSNRDTLRTAIIENKIHAVPLDCISVRNLTDLTLHTCIPADSQALSEIFAHGRQLENLDITCVLKCNASVQFRSHITSLPFLKRFGFSISSIHRLVNDPDLFPAIADFVRGRTQLRSLRLTVCDSETVQRATGFDASVWSVLTTLPQLLNLALTYPRGLAPGLASWLIPRGVLTLGLDSLRLPGRDQNVFLNQLRSGLPSTLRFIGLKTPSGSPIADIIEQGFPMVRVARVGPNYWTVSRTSDGRLELEQWPQQRVEFHDIEWLEWLGCEDAPRPVSRRFY